MTKKKWVSMFVVSGVLISTLLAGCSSDSKSSGSATNVPTGKDPVEISFLTYDGTKNKDGKYLRQLQVDAFNEANPDIKVKLDLQSENDSVEFLKKLDLMSLSGAKYDVTALPSYKDYAERALKDLFAPVDEYIQAEGKSFEDVYQFTADVNGVNYGLPYNSSIYYVILNKKMLDEAGLPVPPLDWTWDDYSTYAKALTKGDGPNKVYGSYMHTWAEYRREALFATKLDNPYVKDDGSSNLADPVFKEWLQFIRDMEQVDGSQITYADAKSTNMAYRDVFFNGKAAMVFTGSWIAADIINTEKFPHDFTTVFAMMPRWKDSPEGRTSGSSTYNAINKSSANKEAAYKFMKFISGDGANIVNEFSTMIGADNTATVKAIAAGNEALIDTDSMLNVWNHPKLAPNPITKFPESFAVLEDIYNVETEKYMVGGQDLDTTIDKLVKQAEAALTK
ncbi:ABC transporter substrate-binding protein [Paenibacillus luteus]|uniref:ABC transporter substrate-binding protein n=1 Tax=Paenibacillus luteus TaxID=2545753 RepID=UPI0013763454|nr:extracellular solute-binding protein [Paenibacillus luteus]